MEQIKCIPLAGITKAVEHLRSVSPKWGKVKESDLAITVVVSDRAKGFPALMKVELIEKGKAETISAYFTLLGKNLPTLQDYE